ncbi:MAG TPA: EamA family transporter RarD [Pseudomonadales bacterium]
MAFALTAYCLWGVLPVYFKAVAFAGALEIIAHRICWAVLVLLAVVLIRRQQHSIRHMDFSKVGWLLLSGGLLSINWGVFVWALLNDRMIETSLGYYINPLVNIVLGGLFLGERLRSLQKVAVGLAVVGVLNEMVSVGVFPWVGLTLALSFGTYGLVRKRIAVDSVVGLGVETVFLLPLAAGYLLWLAMHGHGALAVGTDAQIALLALGGPLTVIPLVAFAAATLRLPLTVLGFFQYLAPSITLLLAVFVYGEPFRPAQTITFGCIGLALIVFSLESLHRQRHLRIQAAQGSAI